MNERIKELAHEAFQPINDITSEGVADRRTFGQAWFQHYNQKFAELIVRECARVAYEVDGDEGDDYKSGRTWAGIDVLKHFGVEE